MLIAGGGLSGALLALALRHYHPDVAVHIVEPGGVIGGNHLWSFFDSDVAPQDRVWLDLAVTRRWNGYDIAFPQRQRSLQTGYNSILSEDLDRAVRAVLPPGSIIAVRAAALERNRLLLEDQRVLTAACVIDARGGGDAGRHLRGGWQKFVGRMVRLTAPHGLTRPMIMDAMVEQIDGFRFVYVLPFSETDVFVEDTYYSDGPLFDRAVLGRRIDEYILQRGWVVAQVLREEAGCLPVVSGGDAEAFAHADDREAAVGVIGARAALFHAVTSYSLPDAVRTAGILARNWPLDSTAAAALLRVHGAAHWKGAGFYRFLNRMLFGAARPEQRYRVLEHFYRLPEPLIERFYAGNSTLIDRMRILSGKPPVPITAALKAITGRP